MANLKLLEEMLKSIQIEHDRQFYESVHLLLAEFLGWKEFAFVSAPKDQKVFVDKMRVIVGKEIFNKEMIKALRENNGEKTVFFLGEKKTQSYYFVSNKKDILANDLALLKIVNQSYFSALSKTEELRAQQDLIYIDDVTGLFNQRKLNIDLNYYVDHFRKHSHPFCVLFVDVDYFKKVNDHHGHLVGTRILEMMAREIKTLLRDSDFLYRYGGDEFVVLLPDTMLDGGKLVGERILNKIKGHEFEVTTLQEKLKLNLTLSIGVAECPKDASDVESLLSFADRMMYGAKSTGRGTVFYAHDQLKTHRRA